MISVVIRNRNEERWIGHSIQSCINYLENPEIIVVDNNSLDESVSIVKEFCFNNIKVVNIDDYTPGKSINRGIKEATNENVLVLSAHSILTENIDLPEIDKLLDKYVAVFGKQTPVYRGREINKRYVWSHFTDKKEENMWSHREKRHFLHNAFCFYKKSFLLENPFDEKLIGKEDRYWVNDMIEKGYNFLYYPALECTHHWTPAGATWKGLG